MARNDENPRRQPVTPKQLRDYASRLSKSSARLKGLAAGMEEGGEKSIEVEGVKMLENSFTWIKKFIGNCEKQAD